MVFVRKVLNSKFVERVKRQLALKSGIYCKIKVLAPSCSEPMRTVKLLQHFNIDKVFDIGANTGQFAESLIDFGYKGQIISFEPVAETHRALSQRAKKYPNWTIAPACAIGDFNGTTTINVSDATDFSSIKKIKDSFSDANRVARVTQSETVNVCTFDSIKDTYIKPNERIFMKIDTQGFEKEVLSGAKETLPLVSGIKIEIPLYSQTEIYEGIEWDLHDYMRFMKEHNFNCYSMDCIGADKNTGIVTEVDGIFFRDK